MMKDDTLGLEVQPSDTVAPQGIRHVFYKTASAILYLLDFVSNICVAKQYYEFEHKDKTFENINPSDENWSPPPIFIVMVSLMISGHISCFIFFLLKALPMEKHPVQLCEFMRRALGWYFLPVAQFQRALQGLKCRPFNVKGDSRPIARDEARDEARMEALYAIASATTDGGPLFLLQYLALTLNTPTFSNASGKWKPGRLLVLSLCLSALSATWNVTGAIVFLLPSRPRLLALAAGAFTLSALTVRCTVMVSIVELEIVLNASKFFVIFGTYSLLGLAGPFIGYCFLSREGTSEVNCSALFLPSKSTLRAAGFTYVSLSFGPLYPFASVAETCTTMGVSTTRFQTRLCFYATCRWILEGSFMSALLIKKWSLCNREPFHDQSDERLVQGYLMSPMMPCRLYISALAIGLPIAILSQVLFQKLVQTEAVDTFRNDHAENESTVAATGAYEVGSIAMEIVGVAA